MTTARTYPSDISRRQWDAVADLLPDDSPTGRRRTTDLREIVNAINYRWTTGCAWRVLPHDFPPWETVYRYFRRWERDGTLREIREVCLRRRTPTRSRTAAGRPQSGPCPASKPTG